MSDDMQMNGGVLPDEEPAPESTEAPMEAPVVSEEASAESAQSAEDEGDEANA